MGYIGFRLGFLAEAVKLFGTIGGFFLGFRHYQAIGDAVARRTLLGVEWASVLAMGVLVVAGYLGLTRLLRLFERVAKVTFEKRVDQWGGVAGGLVRGLLVTSVVWVALLQLPAPALQESVEKHSFSGAAVSRIAPAVYDGLNRIAGRLWG
jgi:uncharacterized membrane protein required for colicin V production